MTKIRLFLFGGNVALESTIADAEHLKKLSRERIPSFLKWVTRFRVARESYTSGEWEKFRENFGFKSTEELYGALRFASSLFQYGAEIKQEELVSDLQGLGFEQEIIDRLLNELKSIWAKSEDWLTSARNEAIPVLVSLRWRIDIRCASSEYLNKPEVVALLRIGTNDGTETDQICMELDKDQLSLLETVIGKIKREMLRAEGIVTERGITLEK